MTSNELEAGKKWSEHSKEDKEMYVNSFLNFLRNKLLDENITELNCDYSKGTIKTKLWGMDLTQQYNGKETLVIRINHTGELDEIVEKLIR